MAKYPGNGPFRPSEVLPSTEVSKHFSGALR